MARIVESIKKIDETIEVLAEENMVAKNALYELMNFPKGIITMIKLDMKQIYGDDIARMFENECNSNIKEFIETVELL